MKKTIPFILAMLLLFIFAGCSGVSQSDYNKAMDDKSELEIKVDSLQTEINRLRVQNDTLKTDNSKLKSTLATTYDAYRYMIVYVTNEVYGNYFVKKKSGRLTYKKRFILHQNWMK
jgi:outer membrane murein-binding lipoprotein Lpp